MIFYNHPLHRFGLLPTWIVLLQVESHINYSSLIGLRPSVTFSNIMGGGVTYPTSGHREFRLHHYIISRNTRNLFPLHLLLVRLPTLITEPYDLLFKPENYLQVYWQLILCHRNVKNRPCNNLLGHTVVTTGDVIHNRNQPRVFQ